ncbi:MAG: hypothetical protein ACFFAK_18845 [Promethearchaeota archaeon]
MPKPKLFPIVNQPHIKIYISEASHLSVGTSPYYAILGNMASTTIFYQWDLSAKSRFVYYRILDVFFHDLTSLQHLHLNN